ncbi:hypothetical protein BDQ12DRAFT_665959 [Crucibulum laeve]|uniref:Uncharacterized protein n=1 Tax=Crucibulum laeve TaxID=68775 RepID=A0A5C3M0J2_9AGAR|nr:hypothetical protein BDQ12DRAFT_665959 [Crucibulum laeve]
MRNLPQTLIYEFYVSGYIYAAALAVSVSSVGGWQFDTEIDQVFIWDTAINLGDDYQLLFEHKIRPPTVVYYLSRASLWAYIATSLVFQTLFTVIGVCNILAISTTSMLFLLGVIAVFHDSKLAIRLFFVILWIVVSSVPIFIPVVLLGTQPLAIEF